MWSELIKDAKPKMVWCPDCNVYHRQISGVLEGGLPVHVVEVAGDRFAVRVGFVEGYRVPVHPDQVESEIKAQLRGLS